MPKILLDFEREHIEWLYARLQAITKAQGRYLWLLLIGCLYTFAAHFSPGNALKVPLLGLTVARTLVEPFATLFLCLMALAFFGTFEAASFQHRLLAYVAGLDWRQLRVHTIDQHANVLDYLEAGAQVGMKQSTFSLVVSLVAYSLPLTLTVLWIAVLWVGNVWAGPYDPSWLVVAHTVNGALLFLTMLRTVGLWRERLSTFRQEATAMKQRRKEFEN